VAALTLEEALFAAGGYRSALGVLKHLGGWVHVYHSYAFDPAPRHFDHTSWPRGMKDTVVAERDYVEEVVAWVDDGLRAWETALAELPEDEIELNRQVHWGTTAPLGDIVVMTANHVVYHTGELNMLLSIARGEAWEYTEEVEENHISTYGHGVRPGWMPSDHAQNYEAELRRQHEARLAGAG
jgi:hypothetical protein